MRSWLLVLAIAAAGCRSGAAEATLVDLSASTAALRAEFNAHSHEARFLTLLSPT